MFRFLFLCREIDNFVVKIVKNFLRSNVFAMIRCDKFLSCRRFFYSIFETFFINKKLFFFFHFFVFLTLR